MDINYMSRQRLERIPHKKWDEEVECDSLIILPAEFHRPSWLWYRIKYFISKIFKLENPEIWKIKHLHDSGYRCMSFVAVRDEKPICKISGCSDVIHIDGIGGCGYNWLEKYGKCPNLVPPKDWSIDCLATSGFLRIFTRGKIICGHALSSFEIYSEERKEK